MKRAKTNLFSVAMCVACAVQWAGADVVVNLKFFSGSNVDPARTPVGNTYSFDDSSLLFNGAVNVDQQFYGGFSTTSDAGINNFRLRNDNIRVIQMSSNNGTGTESMKFLYVWDDATSGFGVNTSFGDTSDSSFDINMSQWLQNTTGGVGGMHFVLRDSGTYYIANQLFGNSSGAFTAGIAGDTAGLQWASFDPSKFTDYDASNASLGSIGLGTFSARTFDNVEAVGFIAENVRSSGNFAQVSGFEVAMVPEPATVGLLGICGGGLLFIRRRFMI